MTTQNWKYDGIFVKGEKVYEINIFTRHGVLYLYFSATKSSKTYTYNKKGELTL